MTNLVASIMPGWKTQLTAWAGLIVPGAILAVLEFLQNTDMSSNIPAQYYPIYMTVIGVLISIFRAMASREQTKKARVGKGIE